MNFDYTKPNVGNTDRLIRAIVGVLLILAIFRGSWIGGLLGAVLLVTAYFRFCPVYTFFDFSSNKDVTPVSK
ncbi:DUF2892 domain-containing protein [uncultured Thiocystis sp.]|jgi:hypothetical protein|uniref:YgaP family membrane protein n=1 Tax=uncultured Thiocystis sp. TaxID=1202134 RepID=UPI0025F70D15|nr:DUF2892 domain-containing protein [uncultured Thiocystis sp.]